MKKNKTLKRFLAFLLCATVALTFMPTPTPTFADETSDEVTATVQQTDEKPSGEETKPKVEEETKKPEEAKAEPAPVEPVKEEAPEQEETAPKDEAVVEDADESADGTNTSDEMSEDIAEAAEEEENAEPEGEAYPEFSYEQMAGGMLVKIHANEGALPEGVSAKVTAVSTADYETAAQAVVGDGAEVIKAVDITFRDKNGTEIEPKEAISVTFVSADLDAEGEVNIVHVKDNGAAEKMAAQVNGDVASFKSDEFSVYLATTKSSGANKVVVHITNILRINPSNPESSVDGKAVAYEKTVDVSGSKGVTGFFSHVGGRNAKAGGYGANYEFLNEFVLATSESGPVYWETASDGDTISRVAWKGNDTVNVEMKSGAVQTFTDCTDLYISPVYKRTIGWYLIYNYIDNISNGSGSWSNLDFVTQYSHTYSNPEDKSPLTTKDLYKFLYWQNDETGTKYEAGETHSYAGAEQASGSTKTINIYAYWQPSVTVRYNYNGNVVETVDYDDIRVYDNATSEFAKKDISYSADGNTLTIDGVEYAGWYDENGNLLSADKVYKAPEITKRKVERTVYDVYAKKQITVKAADNTWVYDGTEHSDNGATVTAGNLISGDMIEAENTGRITDKGTVDNEVGSIKITRDGKDVTKAYKIAFEKGTLEVTPAPLTITTPSATRAYNGRALTATAATISGLKNGEQATVTATGSQTRVGSSTNTYSISWTKGAASNYTITENLGTLRVTGVGGGGGNPGGGPGVTPAGPVDDGTVVPEEPTPAAEPEVIPDEPTPMAGGVWALINLISAILTALGAVIALFRKKEDEDEDEQNMYKEEDEDDNRGKKMLAAKIAGAVAGIAAPITFILTEDMSLPMVMVDKWTILMLVMLLAQVVAAIFNKKASELDDEDEEAETAAN